MVPTASAEALPAVSGRQAGLHPAADREHDFVVARDVPPLDHDAQRRPVGSPGRALRYEGLSRAAIQRCTSDSCHTTRPVPGRSGCGNVLTLTRRRSCSGRGNFGDLVHKRQLADHLDHRAGSLPPVATADV